MELFNNKKTILAGLSRAFDRAQVMNVESSRSRYIIFSDHHRGDRGVSDYFKKNEKVYNAALGYYLERGFTLIQLGDVEEFWEFHPAKVIQSYPFTYELEKEFFEAGRFIKIRGNHDNLWRNEGFVQKYLGKSFPGIRIEEAVRIQMLDSSRKEKTTLFLTHGHQGSFLSDTLDWFGMFWLRNLQKGLLRIFKQKYQTPAWNYSVREEHEKVMFEWAEKINETRKDQGQSRVLFIAGHTHHPIFMPGNTPDRIRSNINLLKESGSKKNRKLAARLRSQLEYIRADVGYDPTLNKKQSYYFNTGCCSFFDGSITGIEINKGKIKLVKWMDHFNTAERIILGSEKIKEIGDTDSRAEKDEEETEELYHEDSEYQNESTQTITESIDSDATKEHATANV